MVRRLWVFFGLLVFAGGCASQSHGLLSTWEEDPPLKYIESAQPLATATPAKPQGTPEPGPHSMRGRDEKRVEADDTHLETVDLSILETEPINPEQIAADLEIALLHFTSELKMLSNRVAIRNRRAKKSKKKTKLWPKVIQLLWSKVLDELQSGLAIPPDDLMPKRVLLQAHVTTAAEKEITERRFGTCPESLAWRIKDLQQQVHRLLQRNVLARGQAPSPPLTVGKAPKMQWPVSPQIYTSYFGLRRDPINGARKFHTGIDMGADRGVIVASAAHGRVIHSGWAGGYGRMVVVQHVGGYQTVYAHLGRILSPIGAKVDGGSPVGLVGSSGRSTGPHLHFEVRYGGRPIDPMKLLRLRHVSKPHEGAELSAYLAGADPTYWGSTHVRSGKTAKQLP